jgi:hypothetical protein
VNNDVDDAMPLPPLRDLEQEPAVDFVACVRRRIHRRKSHCDLAAFSWHLPKLILTELAGILGHTLNALGDRKDSRP